MEEKFLTYFHLSGFPITKEQEGKIESYLRELKRWGQKTNLTALKDDEAIIKILFIESFSFSKALPGRTAGEILDYGSGAGFPGLPLKIIYPSLKITLLERSSKKWSFLKHICRELDFGDVVCLKQSGEELIGQQKFQEKYEVIVSRGVGHMANILKIGKFLLKKEGLLVAQKPMDYPASPEDREGIKENIEAGEKRIWGRGTIVWECPELGLAHRLELFKKCFT